jgi:Tfp pilus assembly protein PilF
MIASVGWRFCAVVALGLLTSGCFAVGPDPEEVKRAEAEYELAHDAFQRSSYREALAHAKTALEHDPNNAEAAYIGSMIMLVFCAADESSPDCRYPEAEAFIRKALESEPNARDARNALGVILVHLGRPAEAVAVLEPLSQDMLYRSPEKAWGNLGWAYLEAGRTDEAVAALKRSVAAQPLFCVGHYRLGLAYEKKREYAAAQQAFSRALGIEQGGCDRLQAALWGRARVAEKLGRTAEVRKDLERCRELASASPIGRKCAGRLAAVE